MIAYIETFAAVTGSFRGLVTAGTIVAASLLIGWVVDRVLAGGIRRLAALTDAKLDDVVATAIKGVARWVFLLLGLYAALPFLSLPDRFDDEIATGTRLAVMALSIFVAARFASGIAAHYAHRILPSSASLAKIVVNAVILIIGLLVIFQTMGIQITAALTALGVGGLAVALALQDTLANFFAGIQILASKQIRPGDYVRLDSAHEGYVYDIGWRNSTMRMLNNNMVIVPNTKLAQSIVVNYSLEEPDFGVKLNIGVAYGSDLEKVERVAVEVARAIVARVDDTVKNFDPVVRYHTFGDSAIQFNLIVRCSELGAQFVVQHELIKALHTRFAAEGIEIPFPMRTVMVKGDGAISPPEALGSPRGG